MLKWIIIVTTAVIILAVVIYKFFFHSPSYFLNQENVAALRTFETSARSVNYIVTSNIAGRVAMHDIDIITSEKNFSFTRVNMNDSLRKIEPYRSL